MIFIEVLKWSSDFGCDTENGREVMKGVISVFGAGAYNPKIKGCDWWTEDNISAVRL